MLETKQKNHGVRYIEVASGHQGQRIDNYLLTLLKGVPRSYVYRILRRGEVRVNKGRIKASYRLQLGDVVRVPPVRVVERQHERPHDQLLQSLQQAILYEDNRFMVLNKPSGLAVHGGSGLRYGAIEALRALRPEQRELELVHRLDRDTSGCLLISKRRSALRILHQLLRENGIDKRYQALLSGSWQQSRQSVDVPLLKNTLKSGERLVRVDANGKQALTHFNLQQRFAECMLVEARLMTGRTHQIRVHAQYLGTPILGDSKYGDEQINRQFRRQGLKRLFLHAASLRFRWPDETEQTTVEAPLEPSLLQLLQRLGEPSEPLE